MDVQNYLLLQTFAKKEEELKLIEKRQASLISFLKREYETLQILHKPRVTKEEKLATFRNLHNKYTFKIDNQKLNETGETTKNGWLQKSSQKFPQHVRELNERRNKMLQAGNSFSKNNRNAIQEQSIRKVASTMSKLQMKREMLERRNEFGNYFSSSYLSKKGSRPSTVDSLVSHQSSNPSTGRQWVSSVEKHTKVDDELKSNSEKRNYDGESCRAPHPKVSTLNYCDDLINEIKKPSFMQKEFIDDENDELYHRASEVVEISEILKACDEVSEKVSEASREEVIDYDTIDDGIMREVKKTSTQIKCPQIEIDDNELERRVFDDENKDSATACNASMICLNGSMSIGNSLLDEKSDEDSENTSTGDSSSSGDDSVNYLDSLENLAEQESDEKPQKSSEEFTDHEIIKKAHESSDVFSNNKLQVSTAEIDSDDELQPKSSITIEDKMSDSIIMKLQSKLKGMFTQIVDDVTQSSIEKLQNHQNATDSANLTKTADNEASSTREGKSSSHASEKNIRATSTFTSKNQIFTRRMEMQRRRIEGDEDESNSEASNDNSSSDLSAPSEIMKRVVEFDE